MCPPGLLCPSLPYPCVPEQGLPQSASVWMAWAPPWPVQSHLASSTASEVDVEGNPDCHCSSTVPPSQEATHSRQSTLALPHVEAQGSLVLCSGHARHLPSVGPAHLFFHASKTFHMLPLPPRKCILTFTGVTLNP